MQNKSIKDKHAMPIKVNIIVRAIMNLDKKMILLMQALVNVIVISYAAKAVQKNT